MKCETVIELTPDELAQLVAAHFEQTHGVLVDKVGVYGSGGGLLGYEKVVVTGQCPKDHGPSCGSLFGMRTQQLKRFQGELKGALDGVEPVHVDQEAGGSGG